MRPRTVIFLGFLVADTIFGVFSARETLTDAVNKVVAAQAQASSSNPVVVSSPAPAWDAACLSPYDGKPVMSNRCHSEMMWAREQSYTPTVQSAPPITIMPKDESAHTALWFGAALLAGLFALGAAGAGAMWMLRE